MEIVHKGETERHENSETCTAHEYPTKNTDINGAVITITARYPDAGFVINHKCTELIYALEGNGSITSEQCTKELVTGDLIIVPPNEQYFIDGSLRLFIASTPKWHPEQHEHITQGQTSRTTPKKHEHNPQNYIPYSHE